MSKPWTSEEIRIIEDTRDLSTSEVAELLPGRTQTAIMTKRSYLRHGRAIEGRAAPVEYVRPMSPEDIAALYEPHGKEPYGGRNEYRMRRYVDAGIRS